MEMYIIRRVVQLLALLVVVLFCGMVASSCRTVTPPDGPAPPATPTTSSTSSTTTPITVPEPLEVIWIGGPDEELQTECLQWCDNLFIPKGGTYRLSNEYQLADGDSGTRFGGFCNDCGCHAWNRQEGPRSFHTLYCLLEHEVHARIPVCRHEQMHSWIGANIPPEDRYPKGDGHPVSVKVDRVWFSVPEGLDDRWPLVNRLGIGPQREPKGFVCGDDPDYNGEWRN
jgi:hypothetical protein